MGNLVNLKGPVQQVWGEDWDSASRTSCQGWDAAGRWPHWEETDSSVFFVVQTLLCGEKGGSVQVAGGDPGRE